MDVESAEFVLSAARIKDLPQERLPEVAFVGRSNVGKSSLINRVLRRKGLARTSSRPGKTQQLNYYRVNERFYVVDLPGLGYARASKSERRRWTRLIERYIVDHPDLRLIFHLVDSRHPLMDADQSLIQVYRSVDTPAIVLLTKADKLSGNQRSKARKRTQGELLALGLELPTILTSAKTGLGRTEVLQWMGALLP